MGDRGRGRSRGRAGRGGDTGPPGPAGPRPQPPSPWGPPSVAPPMRAGAPPMRAGAPAPTAQAGRASHRITPTAHPQEHPGDADIQQRMSHLEIGSFGTPLDLCANYFTVQTTPLWCLYQYHVDIDPPEDATFLICDVSPGDYHYIQVFNIIIRKCFHLIDLKLIGRDYFDPVAKIDIPEFKLQILPGYKTTINQYEDRLLMVTEIAQKKYNITIHDRGQPLLISRSKERDIRAGMPALVYLVPELSKPLFLIAPLPSWIVLTPERLRRDAESFTDMVMKTGGGCGFRMPKPEIISLRNDSALEYASMCENVIARKNPGLIISKSAMSIATKVAIQINCKLGGAPWCVDIPLPSLMVIGFDVCHDTRSKEKSFGAFVASLDKNMTQYYSAENCPVVYSSTVTELVGEIKRKLTEIYGGETFKMAFIIVSKRINTRIFLANGQNPRPGTVIDDVVTLPE
ncbi:Piwi-like protein, partial [Operophtera brumata]